MVNELLNPKLNAIAKKIRNETLRKKIIELLKNPTIDINGKTYSGLPFETSPAGISRHHSYQGGIP